MNEKENDVIARFISRLGEMKYGLYGNMLKAYRERSEPKFSMHDLLAAWRRMQIGDIDKSNDDTLKP